MLPLLKQALQVPVGSRTQESLTAVLELPSVEFMRLRYMLITAITCSILNIYDVTYIIHNVCYILNCN
jgi:hypothetical protein